MTVLDKIRRWTADSWLNITSGIGQGLKGTFAFTRDTALTDTELEDIFDGDSFGARVVDAVPEQGLRQGLEVTLGDAAAESALAAAWQRHDAEAKLGEAWTWARLYGGAVLFVGANDGVDPSLPLSPRAIRSIDFLTVLDKRELSPASWNGDAGTDAFGEPETYRFSRTGGSKVDTSVVHASRLIRFDGALTSRRRRHERQGWANSELQRVYARLQAFNGAYEGVATLLQDASQGVFKIKDLYGMMAGDKDDLVKRRMALMDAGRSMARAILVDADEEDFTRVEASFAGIPDTLDRFLILLAGASGIPATILMGQSPAGMNATGESDTRNWYDRVRSKQTKELIPRATRLARLFCLAKDGPTNGVVPAGLAVECPSLYQLTPAETATLRKTTADTDAVYITNQVLTPEEVALARFRKEGWSADTTIDLTARQAALDADQAAAGATGNPTDGAGPTGALGAGATTSADPDAAMAIIERVASRTISRESGVALLVATVGMTPEGAEASMGATGTTHFTAPDPGHAAALADAQATAAKATRSQQATKQMLTRVLERNRAGQLVVGRVIAGKAPDGDEGDVLEEGDAISVPAEGAEAARAAKPEDEAVKA